MGAALDLTGRAYGRLVVLGFAGASHPGDRRWICVCECGNARFLTARTLNSGNNKSCGCVASRKTAERNLKHGLSRTPAYSRWLAMKQRCEDPGSKSYPHYGARGIKVCDRWQKAENFVHDMGQPARGMTLERLDSNGDYSPENCVWATRVSQTRNRRMTKTLTYKGTTRPLAEWAQLTGIRYGTLKMRVRAGYSADDAIEKPVKCGLGLKGAA